MLEMARKNCRYLLPHRMLRGFRKYHFDESDDADFDGLTTAQELAAGSDPQRPDTDGDGLDDAYEVSVSHTNPALTDSDGDGQSDPSELLAGTDSNDKTSVFAVKELREEIDRSMTIRWSGQPGKTYRVLRSPTSSFATFDIIATKIAGAAPLTSFTDPAANLPADSGAYYRIEVE